MITKTCSKCGETKALDAFHKCDGWYRNRCKICKRIADASAYRESPSQAKKRAVEYYRTHTESVKISQKKYYQKNKSVIITRSAIDQKKHRKQRTERQRLERKVIADAYSKRLLVQKRGFQLGQITPDLIAAERALIKLKRAIKEKEMK